MRLGRACHWSWAKIENSSLLMFEAPAASLAIPWLSVESRKKSRGPPVVVAPAGHGVGAVT